MGPRRGANSACHYSRSAQGHPHETPWVLESRDEGHVAHEIPYEERFADSRPETYDQEATLWRGSSSTRGSSAAALLCLLLPSFANRWCGFLGGYTEELDVALVAATGTLCASSIGRNISHVRLALTAENGISDGAYMVYSLLTDLGRRPRSMHVEAEPTSDLVELLGEDGVTEPVDPSQPRGQPPATADPSQPLVVGGALDGTEEIAVRTTCAWRRLHVTGQACYDNCHWLLGFRAGNLRSVVIEGVQQFDGGARGRTRACRSILPNLIHLSVTNCVSLGVFDAPSLRSVKFVGQCPKRELAAGSSLDSLALAPINVDAVALADAKKSARSLHAYKGKPQQLAGDIASLGVDRAKLKLSLACDGFGNLNEVAGDLANVRSDLLTFQLRGTFGSPTAADHDDFQAALRAARSACPGKLVKCVVDDPALMVSFAW